MPVCHVARRLAGFSRLVRSVLCENRRPRCWPVPLTGGAVPKVCASGRHLECCPGPVPVSWPVASLVSPAPDRAWLPLVPYTLPSPVTALYIHPLIHWTHGLCFSPNSPQKQGLRHRVYSGPWWAHTQEMVEPALTGPASGASTCKPVRSNPPLSHAESRLCLAYTSSCCS